MSLKINFGRFLETFKTISEIGATERGGNCRLALSDLDKKARDQLTEWCLQINCKPRIDKMGNMFFRYENTNPGVDPICIGSHLDTQPTGGRFDGVFGVLASLEVLRTLVEKDIQTNFPIELVNWTNEEGSRFAPCMIGSGVYSGKHSLAEGLGCKDADGKTIDAELQRIGYKGDASMDHPMRAYIEPHIEQGPILENEQKNIGVVTGALGQKWYDLKITGFESHAGPTPMHLRKDALLAAAKVIEAINILAIEFQPHARGTVGELKVFPNSRNVIPGEVNMSIDIRHADIKSLNKMEEKLISLINKTSAEIKVEMQINKLTEFANIEFDKRCVNAIRNSASDLNYPNMDILSGAGHDAVYISDVVPTGMIFIPCRNGVSHNETEFAKNKDMEMGCNVLLHTILEIDKKDI